MPTKHVCKQNDHISKVAAQHGFRNWNTVWDANKDRLKREDPNTLYKGRTRTGNGDYLDIPDPVVLPAPGGVDAHHPFEVVVDNLQLRVRIFKDDLTPLKDAPYELTVVGIPTPFAGKTSAEGLIEHPILAGSQQALLKVKMKATESDPTTPGTPEGTPPAAPAGPAPLRGDVPVTWTLEIGALNPIKESAPDEYCISGVQQRLNNIGLNTGPIDGILGPNTKAAIKTFQKLFQISGSGVEEGVPDAGQTQVKLYDLHDGPTPPAIPGASGASGSSAAPASTTGGTGSSPPPTSPTPAPPRS